MCVNDWRSTTGQDHNNLPLNFTIQRTGQVIKYSDLVQGHKIIQVQERVSAS